MIGTVMDTIISMRLSASTVEQSLRNTSWTPPASAGGAAVRNDRQCP